MSLFNRLVALYNSLPEEIVTLTTIINFKMHLDMFWSNKIFDSTGKLVCLELDAHNDTVKRRFLMNIVVKD